MSSESEDTHSFQAEVQQLLDIVINSLYTDKEIFVRELVSNAVDALEKLRHLQLTEKTVADPDLGLEINIATDEEANTITVADYGIGMTKDELISNLGTIAQSGSKAFLKELSEGDRKEANIIGQFGVGFYSAYLVADRVEVTPDHKFVGFDGYKGVIDTCDVVLLATSPHFRPLHVEAAVDAGKHLFVEKPIATDAPGVRAMREACRRAEEKQLSVVSGLCYRYQRAKQETVERIRGRFNPSLSIMGVALTMYDRRNRLTDQVADDVRACLGDLVFSTVIPRNVRLSEAPSHGVPALIYDFRCSGSEAYMRLARELIARLPRQEVAA